ncbi:MAG: response regulator [Magnetospirillum sp.]|nr:response regulator [Magnetospirillum sp.]
MKVLLVEDNVRLAEYVSIGLGKAGFALDAVTNAEDGDLALSTTSYDAVILDLGLPDRDGMTFLTDMRKRGETAFVLILTARDTVEDRVSGLTGGADDYLIKPFAMPELVARLRALERRQSHSMELMLSRGNVQFDPNAREARVQGKAVTLSRRETDALEFLMKRADRVVPRSILEDAIYPMGEELASNALDVLIHRLRKHLQEAQADISIVTMRGVGYMLSYKEA